jgi:Protein of unknown function (DUF1549)/Planctomycete cytochrome C
LTSVLRLGQLRVSSGLGAEVLRELPTIMNVPTRASVSWPNRFGILGLLALALGNAAPASAATSIAGPIDFNRDIKPILSDACFACHGPDEKERKASLRLDVRDGVFRPAKSGAIPVVPKDLHKSELIRRLTTTDEDDRMPPAKATKQLSQAQVALLQRWVAEGAEWKGHWAYLKPERPAVPAVKNQAWVRTDVDRFVLARLDKDGITPSPEAGKAEEVDQFLYDNRPDAYERLVDRLLDSPHYGERRAMYWLDLARFADSQGYHHDAHRDIHHWRDWVIQAFNKNMPYDQFSIEQLAGDLLPEATREQRLATGFHRNEMTTSEGGAMPEEYAVKYVVGRIDTTARIWLGSSMACAECHDHKYDPMTQKEYYQFFALFNNVAEHGMDQQENPVPRLTLETPEQRERLAQLNREVAALENTQQVLLDHVHPDRDRAQREWQQTLRDRAIEPWTVLTPNAFTATSGARHERFGDESIWVTGTSAAADEYQLELKTALTNVTALRIEAVPDPALGAHKAGRGDKGEFVLTGIEAEAMALDPARATSDRTPLRLSSWFRVGPFPAASAQQAYEKAFGPESGVDLGKAYADGKLKWTEQVAWSDGAVHALPDAVGATYLHRTITAEQPRWVWLQLGSDDGLQVWWTRIECASGSGPARTSSYLKSVMGAAHRPSPFGWGRSRLRAIRSSLPLQSATSVNRALPWGGLSMISPRRDGRWTRVARRGFDRPFCGRTSQRVFLAGRGCRCV